MYSLETRCIHGEAHSIADGNCSVSFPIYQTACFSHLNPGHNPSGFDCSRESNPTRQFLEETVSSLEGASDTVAFASGMAAITDCLLRLSVGIESAEDILADLAQGMEGGGYAGAES